MTNIADSRTKGIIAHVKLQARVHTNKVMTVLRDGQASSMEITERIETLLKDELEENWRQAHERGDKDLSQRDEFISKNFRPPDLRTVQRILRNLLKEELVQEIHDHEGRQKYSLTELSRDVKYWPEDFGSAMLQTAAKGAFPTISRLDENVDTLVNMFGTYIVFCFMEASRRNPRLKLKEKLDEYNKRDDEERIEALNQIDEVTLDAVKNMFDSEQMYRLFLATVKAQPTDEEIQQTQQEHFKERDGKIVYIDDAGRIGEPPSIQDLAYKHFLLELKNKTYYRETFSTIYELKPKEILPLAESLKKRNERLFLEMMNELSSLIGEK